MTEHPTLRVVVEVAGKRAFASALDWPGWARAGKSEALAIESLLAYRDRYAAIAALAGHRLPDSPDVEVVERQTGNATTEFGVPGLVAELELVPVTSADAQRLVGLVRATWQWLEEVAASAPAELRKGPRGGGRDRDKVVAHVDEAERYYARSIGIRLPASTPIGEVREEIVRTLSLPSDGSALPGGTWPQRYAARRIAWHVMDHAWEIEDRSAGR